MKTKHYLLFLLPLIIAIDMYLYGQIADLLSKPCDLCVFAGILAILALIAFNVRIIISLIKLFTK